MPFVLLWLPPIRRPFELAGICRERAAENIHPPFPPSLKNVQCQHEGLGLAGLGHSCRSQLQALGGSTRSENNAFPLCSLEASGRCR